MTIPSQFIIRRYVRGAESKLCAFIQSFIEVSEKGERVSFTILPIEISESYYIKVNQEYWGSLKKNYVLPTTCIRYVCNRQDPIEYKNSIWYEGYVVSIEGRDIPMFNMDQACQILPAIFMRLIEPKYANYQLQVLNSPPKEIFTINEDIELYLKNHLGDECPITVSLLTKENICLTPCGHGIDHVAMLKWLETKENCPVCRCECTSDDLLVYKNL